MAGLGDLFQRIARSLEEASAQRPGDDLRARLGYGTEDEDEGEFEQEEGSIWEPQVEPEAESVPAPATARTAGTMRAPEPRWVRASESLRPSAGYRTPASEVVPTVGRPSPAAPHHPRVPPGSMLAARVRARLHTPDALREAFVVKEVLDRPLARRRRR